MSNNTVIRRGAQGRSRFQQVLIWIGVLLLVAVSLIAAQVLSPAVLAWKAVDYGNVTRQDLVETLPGEFLPNVYEDTDIWRDEGVLFDRELYVYRDQELERTFRYAGADYPDYDPADAIIVYSLTWPLVEYIEIWYEWIYLGDD